MRFISLFAGVGGFDLGFERAGHECVLQVEQDQHCLEVLRRRWPNVPKMEDVRDVNRKSAPDVDMVIGGFPCQDVSISGGRRGLDGGRSRSGLWFEFHRILRELRPKFAVIENVPGLFSSNGGRDFGTILRGLSELRRMSAWRVLDSQFFGVPQRRRRIFIVSVANPGGGACAEILFERESVRRDSAKSRKPRPGSAGEPQGRPGGDDTEYTGRSASDRISGTNGTSSTLNSGGGGTGAKTGLYCIQENVIGRSDEHGPAGKGYKKDISFTLNATAPHAVTYSTPGLGNIKEDTVSSTLLAGQGLAGVGNEQQVPAFVQETTYAPEVAEPIRLGTEGRGTVNSDGSGNMIAFQQNQRDEVRDLGDVAGALPANPGMKQQNYIAGAIPIDMQNAKGVANPKGASGIGKDGDPAYTLNSTDQQWVSATVTAKWAKQSGGPAGSTSGPHAVQDTVGSLQATDYKGPRNQWLDEQKYIQQSVGPLRATDYKGPRQDDPKMVIQDTAGTLAPGAHPGGFNGQDAYTGNLIPQQAVRRLTPVECCRLQGFPDDWNDDQTDSQRYRQMGNAVTVNVAEWIGRRIANVIKT